MIVIQLSTEVTPGADHAARSASSFSAHERTLPRSVTLPPETSTVMRQLSANTSCNLAASAKRIVV